MAVAAALTSCDLPRDPYGTARRVENGVLRVGVSENPPWVRLEGPEPKGVEPALVRAFAAEQHAKVQWVRGGETPLAEAMRRQKVDLIVGGVTADSPWKSRLGTTRPYLEAEGKRHVWLTAQGENAFLLRLDTFLAAHKNWAKTQLAAEEGR